MKFTRLGVATGVLVAAACAASSTAAPRSMEPEFTAPVRLTPTSGYGGFEPTLVVDHANNTWITAHKSYHGQVSPDAGSAAGVRSSSWLWITRDGKSFSQPPGKTPLREHEQFAGDEGDLAVSPDNDVYFIDLGFASSGFAAWHVNGPGDVSLQHEAARLPHVVAAADRPFVAAGPKGTVLIVQNQVPALALGTNSFGGYNSDGSDGPLGAAELFFSSDGGKTFDSALPYVVNSGQFCRPLVDRLDPKKMLVVCTTFNTGRGKPEDASDIVFSMRSTDGGKRWTRTEMRRSTGRSSEDFLACLNFPSVAQDRNGTVHAVCNENEYTGGALAAVTPGGKIVHYMSRDFGTTWTSRDITPGPGIWNMANIAVAPNGLLGLGVYYRPDTTSTWQYRAGVFKAGGRVRTVEVSRGQAVDRADAGTAPGDFNQVGFGPDNKLRVTYNVADFQNVAQQPTKFTGLFNVYYSQQK